MTGGHPPVRSPPPAATTRAGEHLGYYLTEIGGAAGDQTTIVVGGELDLSFVDSTAIGVLLHASAQIRETRGRLSLICTNRNVLRTVEIAGLERHIAVSRTPR